MEPNYLFLKLAEMKQYCEMYRNQGDALNWNEILKLNEHPTPIVMIQVSDDSDNSKVIANAQWGWGIDNELKLGKVEVIDDLLKRHGIGTTIVKMIISIAMHYKAPRITGTIAGKPFLWNWYQNLGFSIYDDNKLLLEFPPDFY